MLEYQNIKAILQTITLRIGLKRSLCIKKGKILCYGHILLAILPVKRYHGRFTKRTCKKMKNSLELKK